MFDINKVLNDKGQVDETKITDELNNLNPNDYKEAALLLCGKFSHVINYFSYEKLGASYSEIASIAVNKQSAAIMHLDKRYMEEKTAAYGKLARIAAIDNRALFAYVDKNLLIKHKELFAEIMMASEARLCDFPSYLYDEIEINTIPIQCYKYVMLKYFSIYPQCMTEVHKKFISKEEVEQAVFKKNNKNNFSIPSSTNDDTNYQWEPTSSLTESQFNDVKALFTKLDKEANSCWPYPNKDRKHLKAACLKQLLNRTNKGEDASYVINQLIEKHPALIKGERSTRTFDLLEQLKEPNVSAKP